MSNALGSSICQTVDLGEPPGPAGELLFGSAREAMQNPLAFNMKYWRQYGDYLRFRALPGITWYLFTEPAAVEHILQTNQLNYGKPSRFKDSFGLLGGNGLLTADGDSWLRQRRMLQPAFHKDKLASLGDLINTSIEVQITKWEEEKAETVNLFDEMMKLTLDIVGRSLFSVDLGQQVSDFRRSLDSATNHIAAQVGNLFPVPLWVGTPRNKKFLANKHRLDQLVYRIVAERRQMLNPPSDLLDMLMNASDADSGEVLSDTQLRDEVITLLIAGHETLALSLTWCLYLLGKNPDAKSILFDELSSVLGGRFATIQDLEKLTYTKMVLQEALRLYPPIWGMPRQSKQSDQINGYKIPAGATISLCQFITHRHPNYWHQPNDFKPERFQPEVAVKRPKFAYFPFGGGGRTCIANNMALMEGQLAIANILQRYDFEILNSTEVEPEPKCTLQPKSSINARIRRRG